MEKLKMDIISEIKDNMYTYADEVNLKRAIPYLSSGLKPIGLLAIWSLYANKHTYDKPYTKSQKATGELMNYSPHADAYEALVRMAQDFIYPIPLLDGHGGYGSVVSGDDASSARYTGIRLTEFVQDILLYNPDILDMGLNYLEEDEQPILSKWVSLVPLLFISHLSGMGYGKANTWVGGNLIEFRELLHKYMKSGKVDYSLIYPDFPTGGIIINKSKMADMYKTGDGTVKLRGEVSTKGNIITIHSLPYQVYPETFLESLKDLTSKVTLPIKSVANHSDKDGVELEIICNDESDVQLVLNYLYAKTNLQVILSNNRVAITRRGIPEMITMERYLDEFILNNRELVVKESNYFISKNKDRLEVLNGLISALDMIDKIIALIKKSKSKQDAKDSIMTLGFTELQTQAIVDMPLGRLANLEQIKLRDEQTKLDKELKYYTGLLNDEKARDKHFLDRFDKLVDKYGWERRTKLADIEEVKLAVAKKEMKERIPKKQKEYMVALSSEHTIKSTEVVKYKKNPSDLYVGKFTKKDNVVVVTETGMMYKIPVKKIDVCLSTAQGMSFDSFGITDKVIFIDTLPKDFVLFVSKLGLVKKCEYAKSFGISKKSGAVVMGFKQDGDKLYGVYTVDDTDTIQLETDKRTIDVVVKDYKPSGRTSCGKNILKKSESLREV